MENTESRLYFASDYMEGAHPAIMKKLMETNLEKTVGYGQDPYTEDAKETMILVTSNSSVTWDFGKTFSFRPVIALKEGVELEWNENKNSFIIK